MTKLGLVKSAVGVLAALVIAGCTAEGPRDGLAATDKFEPTNRVIHNNNVRLDRNVLRPVSEGYGFVTPTLFKHLIGNGISHLELPKDFANYLLQGDMERSLDTLGRFTINTVVGAAGFLDPAKEFGLPKQSTDFGITLGTYGVGEGNYLVLPLLGPSTMRDVTGFVVDRAFSPTTYVGLFTAADAVGPLTTGLEFVDRRNRNADLIDEVLYNSPDSYVTLRSAYLQRRRAQIAGDEGVQNNLPDIFDDEAPAQ